MRDRPWLIIPGVLACILLAAAGILVGTTVGAGGSASTAYTLTQRVRGQVVTVNHHRMVYLPARTVHANGRVVQLAARTIPYTAYLAGTTLVRTVNGTVLRTITGPGGTTTLSGPTTTIPGPTTTDISTSTVTTPGTTVTGPPVTITETTTVTGPTTTITGPTTTVTSTVTAST